MIKRRARTPTFIDTAPRRNAGRHHSCSRCGGAMVMDYLVDMLDDSGEFAIRPWRCLCCGSVTDPVIARNRRTPPAVQKRRRMRPRKHCTDSEL